METIDQSTIIANNVFYLLFPGNQPYRRFKMPQKCGFSLFSLAGLLADTGLYSICFWSYKNFVYKACIAPRFLSISGNWVELILLNLMWTWLTNRCIKFNVLSFWSFKKQKTKQESSSTFIYNDVISCMASADHQRQYVFTAIFLGVFETTTSFEFLYWAWWLFQNNSFKKYGSVVFLTKSNYFSFKILAKWFTQRNCINSWM